MYCLICHHFDFLHLQKQIWQLLLFGVLVRSTHAPSGTVDFFFFHNKAHALVFNCNDLLLCCVCSAVSRNGDGEETQEKTAGGTWGGGEGAGAAWDCVAEGVLLWRIRSWRSGAGLLPTYCPNASPPQEKGEEDAKGRRQGQHTNVPPRVAPHWPGGRGLQAVYSGQAGRSWSRSLCSSFRLPSNLCIWRVGVSHRISELTGLFYFGVRPVCL